MDRLTDSTEILAALVGFATVSADSNLALIGWVAERLEAVGARVELFTAPCGTKANLFATLGPERDGGIVLSGHTDVVPATDQLWRSDPFTLTARDDRLYGRGSCDMKGFIAACLAMAPALAAAVRHRPLHFAFTYDEEIGCFGARHLAEVLRARGLTPGVAIIGEPTEMRIIEGHKGCHEYTTRFTGHPGHGSRPELGVNAVAAAVRYVHRLLELGDRLRDRAPPDSRFTPPWTTVNIGALNGGVAHNVIAPTATVDWEMRPVQPEDAALVHAELTALCDDELLPAMRAVHPEAGIALEVIGEVAGLVPAEVNEAREIVAALTGAESAELAAFSTEAGLFQALGTAAVVCGPGSIAQAHKADEYLALDQLAACLAMLDRLGPRLAAAPLR